MGSLSKLMQKLDELELRQDIKAKMAEDAENPSASEQDSLPANEATPGGLQPEDSAVDAEASDEPAADNTAEANNEPQIETEAVDPNASLIDDADVEALIAEHGPEDEAETEADFDAVETEAAVELQPVAQEPIEAAVEEVSDLIDQESPASQQTSEGSGLFSASEAADDEPKPAHAELLDNDNTTAPWDAAKVDSAVIAYHNRYAAMCEQYRSLRARIFAMNPSGAHQIITVTSSVPEEGKSVTTMNLAICIAESSHQRVLVVDADFRRASVARMVSAKHSPGMAEFILEQERLEDVIQHTPYPNLKIVSAGKLGASSYGELMASPRIPEVFEQLRKRYSFILLDTPPVTTVSDVSMLAPLTDGALMVVEMGRTPEPTVQLAVRTLQTNNVNVLGCVLSRYRDQRKHYYDRYYDYYDRH